MITYENLEFEVEVETKDEKKGVKDAKKALKKLEVLSKDNIQDLIDSVFAKTTNSEYVAGYVDICRQAMSQITVAA